MQRTDDRLIAKYRKKQDWMANKRKLETIFCR